MPKKAFDPFADLKATADITRSGVLAQGELLRPEILGRIGDTLGGLNSIGALRSGGARAALDEINRDFTNQFGNIATSATLNSIGQSLQAGQLRLGSRQQDFQEAEARRRRRAALLGAIGNVVGAGIGFAVGGPVGAAAGASIAGNAAGGKSVSGNKRNTFLPSQPGA